MDKPDNPAAFPCTGEGFGSRLYTQHGMTLRDYFAGQCVSQFSIAAMKSSDPDLNADWAASCSYKMADAMLAERSKSNG